MPSGYENSPDYAGPPPTIWGLIGVAAVVVAIVAALVLL